MPTRRLTHRKREREPRWCPHDPGRSYSILGLCDTGRPSVMSMSTLSPVESPIGVDAGVNLGRVSPPDATQRETGDDEEGAEQRKHAGLRCSDDVVGRPKLGMQLCAMPVAPTLESERLILRTWRDS